MCLNVSQIPDFQLTTPPQVTQAAYQATQGGMHQPAWQPKPSRSLYLSLTDGVQKVKALEMNPLNQLADWPKPGSKVRLTGPLVCRRGVVLLSPSQLVVLGGEVEELAERHTAKKLLEQRLGREDVGQENRFAVVTDDLRHRDKENNQNLQNGVDENRPTDGDRFGDRFQDGYQEYQDQELVNAFQEDEAFPDDPDAFPDDHDAFSEETPGLLPDQELGFDEDDEMLLMAASQVEQDPSPWTSSLPRAPLAASQVEQDPSPWTSSLPRAPLAASVPRHSVAVVGPLASTSTPVSTSHLSTAPLSSTFISPTISISPTTSPVLLSIPTISPILEQPPTPQAMAREPWTYLHLLLPLLKPGASFTAKLKVVSATLASKISLKKTSSGPAWSLSILINDGSGSVKAGFSPGLLDQHLGSADDYMKGEREGFKEKSKEFGNKLASLSCVVEVEIVWEEVSIVDCRELTGLHLAQMMRRGF